MATFILNHLVDPILLTDREFSYQRAYVKTREGGSHYKMREFEGREMRKVSLYFRDPATASWRCAEEPHHVRGFLGFMIIAAAAHFLAVQGFLAIQFGMTALKIPFLCYKKSYALREKKEFSEIFFKISCLEIGRQKDQFLYLQKSFFLGIKSFLSMFVAAVAGSFSRDMNQVLKMQIIFSEMEKQWNQGIDFDRKNTTERDWHMENGVVSHGLFHIRNALLKQHSFAKMMSDFLQSVKESNRAFYLFPCAQPLSQKFISRLEWIPGHFSNYGSIESFYKAQIEKCLSVSAF